MYIHLYNLLSFSISFIYLFIYLIIYLLSNSRWIPFRTKWLWVRLQSLSLNVQILRVMYSSKMPILTRAKAQTAATCPCGFSREEFQQPRRDHMILFFRRKVKKIFLKKKNTWKYDIFFKCSEKKAFSKKLCRSMIVLVLSGKMAKWHFFHPENMISFSLDG